MALSGALSIGRSGLINSQDALGVIGNNIANVGTVGFKASRTEFANLLSADAGGAAGDIGLGARIGAVRTLFTQGAIENTGRSLDLSIDGQGFFIMREGAAGRTYSRNGAFELQPDGRVTNVAGHVLQGNALNPNGTVAGGITDVTLQNVSSAPQATTTADLQGNLQSDAAIIAGGFVGTSFQNAYNSSNYSTNVQVFDSLGKAHNVTAFFTRTGANAWAVNFGVDAGETGGTAGNLQVVGTGTLTFNTNGTLASAAGLTAAMTFTGAAASSIAFNAGTVGTNDGIGQYASPSTLTSAQNGFGTGGVQSIGVDESGNLIAVFDNGQSRPLYRLALAQFAAPEGLASIGNQEYRATLDSGDPTIGFAQEGGNGTIVSSALEQSNVQLAQEFIDLISTQRSFQANARVITTSDNMLNELVNVVR